MPINLDVNCQTSNKHEKKKKVTARIKASIKNMTLENNVRVVAGFFLFFEWLWPNCGLGDFS